MKTTDQIRADYELDVLRDTVFHTRTKADTRREAMKYVYDLALASRCDRAFELEVLRDTFFGTRTKAETRSAAVKVAYKTVLATRCRPIACSAPNDSTPAHPDAIVRPKGGDDGPSATATGARPKAA